MAEEINEVAPVVQILSPDYHNLETSDIINDYFDREWAFERAMNIFFLSFPKKNFIKPEIYLRKRNEFYKSMNELFRSEDKLNFDEINQLDEQFSQQPPNGNYIFNVGVKRFFGRQGIRNPSIFFRFRNPQEFQKPLDVRNELQNNVMHSFELPINQYLQNIKSVFTIRLNANEWPTNKANEELKEFNVRLMDIPMEGLEEWIHFGKGVLLLVKIEIQAEDDPNIPQLEVSEFHLHTIVYMAYQRLLSLNSKQTSFSAHVLNPRKHRVSTYRPRSDPNLELANWFNQLDEQTVKYCDLQIGVDFHDDFPDAVCLCNEWCNWNAFFHYNPIYRFLLVGHNQLFMSERCHIPYMYQLAAVVEVTYVAPLRLQLRYIPETPVIRLISSANDYRKLFHKKYQNLLSDVEPSPEMMTTIVYKLCTLLYTSFIELSVQSDPTPFSAIGVDNIITFAMIVYDLHQIVGQYDTYVDSTKLDDWAKEMKAFRINCYQMFLELNYDRLVKNMDHNYDKLFTEDYEYSSLDPRLEAEEIYHQIRQKVMELPINIKVISSELITVQKYVFKYLKTVQPMLVINREDSEGQPRPEYFLFIMEFWSAFEFCFTKFGLKIDPNVYHFNYDINNSALDDFRDIDPMHFNTFYTLKLYSIGYAIQSSCMDAILHLQHFQNETDFQLFTKYKYVFDIEVFERQFRIDNGIDMFVIDYHISDAIIDFYLTFWSRSSHETEELTDETPAFFFIQPVFGKYLELYCWWKAGGQTHNRFTSIFRLLADNFNQNLLNAKQIFETRILPTFDWLLKNTIDYVYAIPDQLVYYLVEANCYVLLSTISSAFSAFYEHCVPLQTMINNMSFVLSKPGWRELFDTILDAFNVYIDLKTTFIVFDDEFERIDNALEQTYRHIKGIYREFYKKIVWHSLREITQLCAYQIDELLTEDFAVYLLAIHIPVLIGLIAYNMNVFRDISMKCMKEFLKIRAAFKPFGQLTDPNRPTGFRVIEALHYSDKASDAYLKDPEAVRTAQPLLTTHWETYFQALFYGKPILREVGQDIRDMKAKLDRLQP